MNIRQNLLLTSYVLLSLFALPIQAHAYCIEKLEDGSWYFQCNDGTSGTGTFVSEAEANAGAFILCAGHGGLVVLEDNDVLDALSTGRVCGLASNVTIARDLGGGNFDPLTTEEVSLLLDGAPPNTTVELPG